MRRFIAVFSPDQKQILSKIQKLSPRTKTHPPGGVVLEIPASIEEELFQQISQLKTNAELSIGAASTVQTAILAAKYQSGSKISPGQEDSFLSPLPLGALNLLVEDCLDPELLQTLTSWGLYSLGDLVSLPESELVARIGQKATFLQRLAKGQKITPLQAEPEPLSFEAEEFLDWSIDQLEPLSFLLGRMLEQLCQKLHAQALAAEQLSIRLGLETGAHTRQIQTAFPINNPKVLLSLARLDLQAHPPQAAVTSIQVTLKATHPRVLQYSLLQRTAFNPEKLSRTLARLSVLLGESNLGSPRLLDTHRPDSFQLTPFKFDWESLSKSPTSSKKGTAKNCGNKCILTLRRFRPPRKTSLELRTLAACSGPWRSSGHWWSGADPWSRDEWDVELINGEIYRIFWDQQQQAWFLDGIYD